jgi:hypothetical protein
VSGFWAVFWLAVVLKIPIVALLLIVWWAIKSEPIPETGPSDGGGSDRHWPSRRPRHPRPPRRGPHAEPAPPPPSRVRAHGRRLTPTH